MRIIVVDTEVFAYDWVAVFLDTSDMSWTVYHNDAKALREYMSQPDVIFCGFNVKHYDNHILKAIACGAPPELVKQLSEFIIVQDRPGWEHWFIRQNRFWFDSFDLADDTQLGTSLKHIEAHTFAPIVESSVDFNIGRPLTPDEIEETVFYCKNDVLETASQLTRRKNYLDCKIQLGRMCGLPDAKALYFTNARLTARYLGAERVERYDGREYTYPENLNTGIIPQPILQFFLQIRDMTIPDYELFKRKLSITIGGCPCVYAWGGVHGSLTKYHERSTSDRVIQNRDVSSLYPSLLIKYNYVSRNCADPKKYENTYWERIEAKHRNDKKTASTLKNPLNVTSGAMDQPSNPLYDPRNARGMRISGQLFLTELVVELLDACSTLKLLNFNTDGLMYSVDRSELPVVDRVCAAWEERTKFELETDHIKEVWIKDVNNLMFIDDADHIKKVGGYLNYGIAEKGAWKINNDHRIVKDAVVNYFAYGTPVEATILPCDDIFQFQIVAKAGGGYKSVYQVDPDYEGYKKRYERENRYRTEDGKLKSPKWLWQNYSGPRTPIQKVNRVYATQNTSLGTIVKVKPDGSVGKIGGLPDHCIVDNQNQLTIRDIDKRWYVSLAKKYIEDYTGVPMHPL